MQTYEIEQHIKKLIKLSNEDKGKDLIDLGKAYSMYVSLYDKLPKIYYVSDGIDKDKTAEKFKENFNCVFPTMFTNYDQATALIETEYGQYVIFDETIIQLGELMCVIYTQEPLETFLPYFVYQTRESEAEVYWVTRSRDEFTAIQLDIKKTDLDLTTHYNDDFDYNKLVSFVESKESGIAILHGVPGTGKTYLLRHLAETHPQTKFYFMDRSVFDYIGDASFIDFLSDISDSVIILEDCESLLQSRSMGNAFLGTVLNLADGLIGDGLHIKFLCTFNSNLANIDKAVLRKGSLKFKYEFKELSVDKTQLLAKSLEKNIPETLALTVGDIYNWDDSDLNVQPNKIGF